MSKYRVVVARENVLEYQEVPDSTIKQTFSSFNSLTDLQNYINENSLKLSMDSKFALAHAGGDLTEVAIIPSKEEDPREYIFDSQESADQFIEMQGFKPSIHMMPTNVQDFVTRFFSGSDCDFENCEEIRSEYESELRKAGGTECPNCTRNSIMRKYQEKIIKIFESIKQENNKEK